MKKIITLATVFALVSCNSVTNNSNGANDNDNLMSSYSSPDLQMFNLHGDVLFVYETTEFADSLWNVEDPEDVVCDTTEFNTDGQLVKGGYGYYTNSTYTVERDSIGRLVKLNSIVDKTGFEENIELKYEGNQVKETSQDLTGEIYAELKSVSTYDDRGDCIKYVTKGVSDGIDFKYTTVYTYLEYDEMGNWTKAKVEHTECENDDDGERQFMSYRILKRAYKYK